MTDDLAPCPKCGDEVFCFMLDSEEPAIKCDKCNKYYMIEELWNMAMDKEPTTLSKSVHDLGRIYNLECKLNELIRRLSATVVPDLEDLVDEPLTAADVEEILGPKINLAAGVSCGATLPNDWNASEMRRKLCDKILDPAPEPEILSKIRAIIDDPIVKSDLSCQKSNPEEEAPKQQSASDRFKEAADNIAAIVIKGHERRTKVIVGGYYKTISGQRAHATFREPDECEPMITGHVLRDDAVRCVSWTLEGLSYGSPDDNIRLSTYQPKPFEE